MCFFGVFFGLWKREKNVERGWAEGKFQKKCVSSLSRVHLGLFVALGVKIEVIAIEKDLESYGCR